MSNSFLALDFNEHDLSFGERFLQAAAISLDPDAICWAAEQSQSHSSSDNPTDDPWTLYIHLLARLGIREWLSQRSPRLSDGVEVDVDAVQPIQIGRTSTAIAPTDCLEDGTVEIAQGAIASSPQFHLLVEVLEEINQIQIRGFLAHDSLVQSIQSAALQPNADQTYTIPVNWFDLNPDRFLVIVECANLAPARLPLFNVDLDLNPQRIAEAIARPALNAATWLRDQLDQVAQDHAWTLLPTFSYSPALRSLRSPVEQLDGIVSDLTRYQSVTIPTAARSAAYEFRVDEADLRLYIVTWELPTAGDRSDWMLLAILSPQPDSLLPLGLTLQLRDTRELLSETTLEDTSSTFLYAQVVGTQDERFVISVRSPNGIYVSMPPITFST